MNDPTSTLAQVDGASDSLRGETVPLLLGHSRAFCRLRDQITRVAAGDGPVLLRGERGAGRALAARAIHRAGLRAPGPFAAISCAGHHESLLETDLFGCAAGTSGDHRGLLEQAHGGSILLEDIDQMSPRTQSLLVRFLETGEVHRVGEPGPGTPVDVRVFASTHSRTGSGRVAAGVLRTDLRAHFLGGELTVPALRERRDDIPILADFFARATAERLRLPVTTFTPEAHGALEAYSWPGNIIELKHVVERVLVTARIGQVRAEDLPVGIRPRLRLASHSLAGRRTVAEILMARLVTGGENFWTCVHPLFMRREITRTDVRDLIWMGLRMARGDEAALVALFNRPSGDRRKVRTFLRRYGCHDFACAGEVSAEPGTPTQKLSS
ncbi:MAG: sigma 54-interacting transcriptional regulator [Vicinamibacterales bacterium]